MPEPPVAAAVNGSNHGLRSVFEGVGLRIILMLLVLITSYFSPTHYMHAAH